MHNQVQSNGKTLLGTEIEKDLAVVATSSCWTSIHCDDYLAQQNSMAERTSLPGVSLGVNSVESITFNLHDLED